MITEKLARILLVEDDFVLRGIMASDLKRKGFTVFEADNGIKAFELLQNQTVDVILSDVQMPGGNGVDLLEKVKELNVDLPAVMLITGFSDISEEEAYEKGADAIFSKPFDRKKLHKAIEKSLMVRSERWKTSTADMESVCEVELKFSDIDAAIKAQLIDLGRGGMFIALNNSFPRNATSIQFDIHFESGVPQVISGSGIVRWVRASSEAGLPAGCGIDFEYLDSECLDDVVNFIEKTKSIPYIPRS